MTTTESAVSYTRELHAQRCAFACAPRRTGSATCGGRYFGALLSRCDPGAARARADPQACARLARGSGERRAGCAACALPMASAAGEPPAQPPTAVTAAALFKLAGECAAAIGARASRLAAPPAQRLRRSSDSASCCAAQMSWRGSPARRAATARSAQCCWARR